MEPALLQRALEAALSAAPYYRVQLVQEKRSFFLEPNPNPCLVYQGSAQRDIPEKTNGYLFSVSCEGDTVYFDWYHFLMDGHGVSPFLTRILEQYCNLRYGTAFANTPIVCSPAYDIEAMMEKYPSPTATESTMQRDVVQTWEGRMRRTRVRLTKQSLVDRAVENGVKPFTALAGLLSLALRSYLGKDEIQYSYSADTRREAGVPDALYNCVCSFQSGVKLNDDTRLADIVPEMDAEVLRTLQPEAKLRQMVQQMSWVYKVDQQKAPLRIKQRVFQMGEYISGVPADFWLSYLGNPLLPATPELEQYTKDFNVWVPPDGGSMGVEASSLNGIITLCIENKAEMPGLAGMIDLHGNVIAGDDRLRGKVCHLLLQAHLFGDALDEGNLNVQACRPCVGVAAQPLNDIHLGLGHDDDIGDDHQQDDKDQREDQKKHDHSGSPFSDGCNVSAQNADHALRLSVNTGSTMSRVLCSSVTRQRCPGVRMSPGVAQRAFQSTPSSRTRPGRSAVTVVSTVASRPRFRSPLVGVIFWRSFAASGRNASRHRMLTTMNTRACARNESVNRQVSRAAAAPTANQTEVMLKVEASNSKKPTTAASQRNGTGFMGLPPYGPIIEYPPGGRSSVFYWNVAQKTK